MLKKILLATDLSDASDTATEMALEARRMLDAELVVVYVIEAMLEAKNWFLPDTAAMEALRNAVAHEQEAVQQRLAEKMASLGVQGADVRVLHGRPGDAIVECADEVEADLIVIGTHGRRGFQRAVMGSVATRVARTAGRPVLVVPAKGS